MDWVNSMAGGDQHLGWKSFQWDLLLIERHLWEGKSVQTQFKQECREILTLAACKNSWQEHWEGEVLQKLIDKNIWQEYLTRIYLEMFTWAACNSAIPSLISAWEETLIILATCGKKVRRKQETKKYNRQKTTREERETGRPGQGRSQPIPLWYWCWPAPPDNMALTSSRPDQIQWAVSPPRTASASSGRASASSGWTTWSPSLARRARSATSVCHLLPSSSPSLESSSP